MKMNKLKPSPGHIPGKPGEKYNKFNMKKIFNLKKLKKFKKRCCFLSVSHC